MRPGQPGLLNSSVALDNGDVHLKIMALALDLPYTDCMTFGKLISQAQFPHL